MLEQMSVFPTIFFVADAVSEEEIDADTTDLPKSEPPHKC